MHFRQKKIENLGILEIVVSVALLKLYFVKLVYSYEADRRHYLHADKRRTYTQMIGTNKGAKHFVRWMMYSGRLGQFALAKRLLFDSE